MKLIDYRSKVPSTELAGALLRAWVRGDRRTFQAELRRTRHTSAEHDDTGEAERLQMLQAIADRLTCADPFSESTDDSGIGVCANLLQHLARPAIHGRPDRSGWFVVRPERRSETAAAAGRTPAPVETPVLH